MISIFSLIAITTIWILGLTIVTQPGMGLHSIRKWAEGKESKVFQPLILCPWCMPSIHSLAGYFFAVIIGVVELNFNIAFAYPIVVCGSSFCAGFLWTIYTKTEAHLKYLQNIEKLTFWDIKDRQELHNHKKKNHG